MKKYEPIEQYVTSVCDISTGIKIWQSIIGKIINQYENEDLVEWDLYSSIYEIYSIDIKTGNGLLKSFQKKDVRVTTKTLKKRKDSFFRWIINSSWLYLDGKFTIRDTHIGCNKCANAGRINKKNEDFVKNKLNNK